MVLTARQMKVEISPNGTSWTNISSRSPAIEVSGGDRKTGEVYFFGADVPTITVGPREPVEVKLKFAYTEGATEPFETVRAIFENASTLYVRWAPGGGDTGDFQFSASGPVTAFTYPAGEAESADVILCEVTVKADKVTKSVVA